MFHFRIISILFLFITGNPDRIQSDKSLPGWMKGSFTDDYGINYTITDELFFMEPKAKYHILRWDSAGQYLLTKNDEKNPSEKGLYTRIDYLQFSGMNPFEWGFCLTVYDAADTTAAISALQANREIPKKGCNGFPFSRMKRRSE